MGRSRTSKRVTWAADVNLCQVRMFSKSGMCVEAVQSGGDEELPPGFHDIHPTNLWRVEPCRIPFARWRCPPRFEVNSEWQVVSGEESKEIETQNSRQRRVLEAIYPRPSAIPPNPRAPLDTAELVADDRNTPVVSLTPIEECSATDNIVPPALAHQINLIDHDLLLRILTNPKIFQLQNIITSQGASCTHTGPDLKLEPIKTWDSGSTVAPLDATSTTTPAHPPQLGAGHYVRSTPSKDTNYYKSLIQKHGVDGKQDTKLKKEPVTRKVSKPCIYFNSPRGCRNGDNCAYQHVRMLSRQRVSCIAEVPSAKRVKLSR